MSTKQFFISGSYNVPSLSVTEYTNLQCGGYESWTINEVPFETIIPTPGILSNFQAGVHTAPGAGKSWTMTVRKNNGNTALSVIIGDTDTLSSLDTDEVEVAAGDRVCLQAVPDGTPASPETIYWTCQFTPDTDGETILMSHGILLANDYTPLIGSKEYETVEFEGQTLFPTSGTLKRFYVEMEAAPGVGNARTFTLKKNGVSTDMEVTISGNDTTGNDINPAHNIDIAAGDKVTIFDTESQGDPPMGKGKFGIVFLPDTLGEYIASATSDDAFHNTNTEYVNLSCGDTICYPTEWEVHQLAQETTVKAIYVNLATAPGGGKGFTFTLRRNAAIDTALAVTLTGVTSNNYATDVAISAEDLLDTKVVPSGTPAVGSWQIAYLFYNAWSGKVSGVTNPAKVMGIDVANISKVKGVASA